MAAVRQRDRRLPGIARLGSPAEPIGPEPVGDAPDKRAAWHAAFAALRPVGGPDVRGLPDGALLHLRDTFPVETAWAPRWVGDQLRQVRRGAEDARLAAVRAGAEAMADRNSGRVAAVARHEELAASYQVNRCAGSGGVAGCCSAFDASATRSRACVACLRPMKT